MTGTDLWKSWTTQSLETSILCHGTAVTLAGRGCIFLGASGTGKSALALALIARGATLVSDDRVWVDRTASGLMLRAPDVETGVVECRGIGLLRLPACATASLDFAVDLTVGPGARLPETTNSEVLGHTVPLIPFSPYVSMPDVVKVLLDHGPDTLAR